MKPLFKIFLILVFSINLAFSKCSNIFPCDEHYQDGSDEYAACAYNIKNHGSFLSDDVKFIKCVSSSNFRSGKACFYSVGSDIYVSNENVDNAYGEIAGGPFELPEMYLNEANCYYYINKFDFSQKKELFPGYNLAPQGTIRVDKYTTCKENEVFNPETKQCEPKCQGDMVKNPETGKCECPEYKDDNYGFYKSVFDKKEKRCKVCAPGTYANKNSGTCDTDCSGLPSTIDLMDCSCQLKSYGGFKHSGINPKELASIFEPSFYPYFGDVCYFACEKPGSAVEVRSKKTPNIYKRVCVDLKNSKKDVPINPYPGNDDENPNEEKINPDNYTVVDISDIPENVINDLLNKVKDEIDKNHGKTTTEKQDNITVTKGNDIDIEKIKNKKGSGFTQKITYPKPGVTLIEHSDGSVDLIFDGKKMKKSDKPGKTPGGGTGKTNDNKKDDNKTSGDNGNNDNSNGSTNITNNLNIKDYSKDLKSIVDILKDIERNTAKTSNNTANNGLGGGDVGNIPSGDEMFDEIVDTLDYDFEGEINKAMGYYNEVLKTFDNIVSLIKGNGIPSIKKTNSPTSCPITRSFISPTINEEITWDICKVLYPHKEAYYIMFYIAFMTGFFVTGFKILIALFASFR